MITTDSSPGLGGSRWLWEVRKVAENARLDSVINDEGRVQMLGLCVVVVLGLYRRTLHEDEIGRLWQGTDLYDVVMHCSGLRENRDIALGAILAALILVVMVYWQENMEHGVGQ